MSVWVDVVARARGLSGDLLAERQVRELALCRDLPELADRLAGWRVLPAGTDADPRVLELAIQRRAGARLRLVARWSGARQPLLAPLFEDEDRRSIRAMLRGAAARAPAELRLAGLVPTPALPARALASMAAQADVASVAAQLAAWSNPYGGVLLEPARRQQPDLFELETLLTRTWAGRAHRVAPRCGRAMRVFVSRVVDLENAWTAVPIADQGIVGSPASLFVPGGTLLERDAFLLVTSARSAREATTLLARLLNRSPIAPALSSGPAAEERALRALVREQRDIGCLDPLGPAPIIELLLRSRGESLALRRIMWSISLGAPSSQRVSLPQEAMR